MSASFVPPTDVSPSLAALPAVGSRTSTGADGSEVVGLVVAGAAARGPYAAGALTELLPALAAEGNLPTVLVGNSSGALSCALLAQFADQGERAGESLARIWRDINADAVFTNAWRTLSAVGLRLAAGLVLGRPVGGGLVSLVDTRPLWALAARTFDPDRVTANIRAGLVRSVGVAATFCPPPPNVAARTRVFVAGMPQQRRSHSTASTTWRRHWRCLTCSPRLRSRRCSQQ
ncbi:MAG: patatin-like phospholipase family protein [Frankiaceae bacterium]